MKKSVLFSLVALMVMGLGAQNLATAQDVPPDPQQIAENCIRYAKTTAADCCDKIERIAKDCLP